MFMELVCRDSHLPSSVMRLTAGTHSATTEHQSPNIPNHSTVNLYIWTSFMVTYCMLTMFRFYAT